MMALSSVNSKYTAEQLTRVAGVSAETLANWGLVDSTDSLTIAELAELAVSDKQAKNVLDKIIAQNAQAVANGEVTASNIALASSEGGATLATGAFTTAIKANISAMWTWMTTTPLGWLTLLAAGVFAAVKAYDALTVSVEEQKEKMEESLSAYEDAKSELSGITTELENQEQAMNELLAKEKLTYAEKGQLEELQAITRELRIQKDLAEKEEDRTEKQLAKDATDLFDKQFGDYEISEQAINKYQSDADITGNNVILISDENDISAMIAGYKQFNELLDEAYGSGSQDDIDHFKSLTEDLENSIFTTAQELQTQQDNISAYYESIKNTPYEDLTTEQKEIVDTYNAISNAIALIYQQLDPNTWNSMQVDNIFSTDGIEKTKDELVAMAQSGELTPETIKGYTNLNNALGETTLSAQDLCNELYAIADAQGEVQGSTSNNETNSSFLSQLSKIESLSEGLDQIGKIYSDVKDKEDFDWSSILNNDDFKETFQDMANAPDALKDSYNNFIETVSNFPDNIEACQEAFNDLTTAYLYNSGVLDNVTEDTKVATIAMLKQWGVVNAEEIVTAKLSETKAKLAAEEQYLTAKENESTIASNDLTSATFEEISALINLGYASKETKTYLANLALSKLDVANIKIDTKGDIDNIVGLANAAGTSAEYVNALKTALINLQNSQSAVKTAKNKIKDRNFGILTLYDLQGQMELNAASKFEKQQEDILANVLADIQKANLKASDFYADYQGNKDSTDNSNDTKKTFDWIETLISRIQRSITNLGKTVSATYKNWTIRNNALAQEFAEVTKEINLQKQAYDSYIAKANSIPLSESYKELVRNGGLRIEDISNDDLQELISKYQEWYDKALECEDALQDLYDTQAELVRQKFDNISKQYDNQISIIEHEIEMLNGQIDQTESKGYLTSINYYKTLIDIESKNIELLQNKFKDLNEVMNNGTIEKYSEEWYDMQGQIYDVSEAIQDANSSLIEYANSMRQIQWDAFDLQEEYISKLTEESNFLIELLSNRKLIEESGEFTNYGDATVGLYAVNYNTYMQQADDYANEILKINKELANDQYNKDLIERRNELLELQRESIQAAEDEKQSIKDLVSESYDSMLSNLQKLIDKRKEALEAEKDLYDYQRSIAEKTKSISDYQKQLEAYAGDMSEETQAKVQKIKLSLEEAQQDLQDAEYDKWLDDQTRLMDDLYSEFETLLNQRLDDLDALIQNMIDQTNMNAESIQNTINNATSDVGYTLTEEMKTIWNTSDGIGKVVSDYAQSFKSIATATQNSIDGIKSLLEKMVGNADKIASTDIANNNTSSNMSSTPVSGGSSSSANTSNTSENNSNGNGNSSTNSGWGSWFIPKKDYYNKSALNKDVSIVDRLKWRDFDSSFSARKTYYAAMGASDKYKGSASQNKWMIEQMKAHGYKTGSRYIPHNQIAWTQENGGEIIYRSSDGAILTPLNQGDKVFTKEMSNFLWDFAKNGEVMKNSIPKMTNNRNGDVSLVIEGINMYGVNDPEQFTKNLTQALNAPRIKKIVQDNTLGLALGKNSLNGLKR